MLDAAEALFFESGDEPAVADENGGNVRVINVDAEDVHGVGQTVGAVYAPIWLIRGTTGAHRAPLRLHSICPQLYMTAVIQLLLERLPSAE